MMNVRYDPVSPKMPPIMLHGADYSPEQWMNYPEVLKEDIRLMKLAKCNVMSIGIFAWAALEPEEGVYAFEWMDELLDTLTANGIYAFMATPSGARPPWMSEAYPEVLRVNESRVPMLHGLRHNHCFTSPVYREKVMEMNRRLAERYSDHPAILGWHISNEYSGECHCRLCQEAFRSWLRQKYITLDKLNHAYWAAFWSHTYTDWSQLESPSPIGEALTHGLNLDWKRFVTEQTVDFCRHEIQPFKAVRPDLPVTTNLMGTYKGLNYWKFAELLDVISWDNYPQWHRTADDVETAIWVSLLHDLNRSFKGGKPFLMMESTPSTTNWMQASKLKKPGMHLLSSLQAVAHGSDSVQYFQWRKSRGGSEKFHGAVVDHCGLANTRVFGDVTGVGETLERLSEITGTTVSPEVAVVFDWENRWAMEDSRGPRNAGLKYEEAVKRHYAPFWRLGVPVDVIEMDCDFAKYKVLIAPMLYMVKPGVGERMEQFVQGGGIVVATYWSGIVDEHDLCFMDGSPGPLRKVLGIWSEEIDALYEEDANAIVMADGNSLGMEGAYEAKDLCDLIHLEGAEVLARYGDDFYAGRPALTVNRFGKGTAYYIASCAEAAFYDAFYAKIIEACGLRKVLGSAELPDGVTAQLRTDGSSDYLFLMNFAAEERLIALDRDGYSDLLSGEATGAEIRLEAYGVCVLKRENKA